MTSRIVPDAGGISLSGTSYEFIPLSGTSLNVAGAAILAEGGSFSGPVSLAIAGGEVDASGGTLVLDGNVAMRNASSIAIAGGALLDLVDGASGLVVFGGANAELIVNDLALDTASVAAMVGMM